MKHPLDNNNGGNASALPSSNSAGGSECAALPVCRDSTQQIGLPRLGTNILRCAGSQAWWITAARQAAPRNPAKRQFLRRQAEADEVFPEVAADLKTFLLRTAAGPIHRCSVERTALPQILRQTGNAADQ